MSEPKAPAAPKAAALPAPQDLDAEELAWASGLFEGEGSYGIRRSQTVTLSLAMTDKDVVEHFRDVIGAGRIRSQPPGRNGRTKTLWRVDVDEVDEVLRIIRLMYPRLGLRRRERADEVIATLEARIEDATQERPCAECTRKFRPPFTPNAKRTRFCSRRCERHYRDRARYNPRPGKQQIGLDI